MTSTSRAKVRHLSTLITAVTLVFGVQVPAAAVAQETIDPVTGFPREQIHVASWPGGKKVAVSFALFVEEFGFGQGPVYRSDLASRNPDLVNEAFRQYGVDWGIVRVGRLFKELDAPLTIVLNAEFPAKHPSVWREFRASQPDAPIVAYGLNNTDHMLPLGRGLTEQKAYIRRALDMITDAAGSKPLGWSSPSVYSNGDTPQAVAAEGIAYTLDQMDSDVVERLRTPDGPLVLLPYPSPSTWARTSLGCGGPERSRRYGLTTFWSSPPRLAPNRAEKPLRSSAQLRCAAFSLNLRTMTSSGSLTPMLSEKLPA
jgi:allantoinase